MLIKLIKYDLKYEAKIFIILHAVMLGASILGRFFFLEKIDFSAADQHILATSLTLFISLYAILFASLCFGVLILITVRFYKNLFSSEGYLTWTLPATPSQQLWAKIFSGTILYILDIIICAIGVLILVTGPNVTAAYAHIAPEITEMLGMSIRSYGIYMFTFMLVCALPSTIMIYVCLVIGQLFPGHRLLLSMVAYFVVTFVLQVLTFAAMFGMGLFPGSHNYVVLTDGGMLYYLLEVFKASAVLIVISTVIEYGVMHYIMNKKINLG